MIGILGGIGSGKSSVVRQVSGLNLSIIDADQIGHELLFDSEIQQRLREEFGTDVFSDHTTINRSELAKKVFGDSPAQTEAREKLNAILHPAIRQEIHRQLNSASRDVDAVILDAALLLEGGWDATCDRLIFVDTPQHLREKRVQENRGWSVDELARREASQRDLSEKRSRADFVVNNAGTLEEAALQMSSVLQSILTTSRQRFRSDS